MRKKNVRFNARRPEAFDKKYVEWRKAVYKRDGHKCVCCGKKYRPSAHHLNGWAWCFSGRYDVKNGVTLCGSNKNPKYGPVVTGCHDKFHKLFGNKDNTRVQFEMFLSAYYKKKLSDIL
jgi:hypothetical protein